MAELHQIFRACCLWPALVLLWRSYDALCTSGFVDDVILGQRARIKHDVSLEEVRQVAVRRTSWTPDNYSV